MSTMSLTIADWSVLLVYLVLSLGLGLWLSRRGGRSLNDYFLSGRQGHWLLVGTGMVATTFAADTPLSITGLVGTRGISGNWLWWSAAIGGMFTVWFFARLWRRAEVLTDLELIEVRYSSPLAGPLRGIKAIYFGLFLNSVVMAWVNVALLRIFEIIFPQTTAIALDLGLFTLSYAQLLVVGCALLTVLYVSICGLWGVMIADAFQFVIALIGCIVLAVYAAGHPAVQAGGGLAVQLPEAALRFIPDFSAATSSVQIGDGKSFDLMQIGTGAFLAFILVQWWASWYPGAEPGGGGYIAQRIMSAKDERHGLLATLWFVIAHYSVRTWPWVIAALCAILIYPELQGAPKSVIEGGYAALIRDVLPSPMRGLLLAAFLGAYMSTISTQLNWGASYLVNDFYNRFIEPEADTARSIFVSRIVTVLLLIFCLVLSFSVLTSISSAWEFLLSTTAGMGFVLILRWYWSRINATAEMVSMVAPLLVIAVLWILRENGIAVPQSPVDLFIIAPVSVLIILIAMYLTPPESRATLESFYRKVRVPGPGWRRERLATGVAAMGSLGRSTVGWIAGVGLVYGALFFVGAILLSKTEVAIYTGLIFFISLAAVIYVLRLEYAEPSREPE